MSPDSLPSDASATADADDAETAAERRGALPEHTRTVLLHREITAALLSAFYSVHSELGAGFLEAVYANAMTVLLTRAGIPVKRQVPFDILFHGQIIGHYRADLIVAAKVVVEIKAAKCIVPQHTAQLLNYLKASRLPVGLLLNFGGNAEFTSSASAVP